MTNDPVWVWTRLRASVIFMIIDSMLLLFALIRMGCIIRKYKGININIWYMVLHYTIFVFSITSLYFAYSSTGSEENNHTQKIYKSLHMTFSVYMACKFVMTLSITYIIFEVARRQKNAV